MPRKGKKKIKETNKKRKIGEEKEMVPTGFCKAEDGAQMAVISWSIKMTLVGRRK